ncbi:threonine-phosphate decarboxylase CobD [Ancylothrix sp. C2]|uniref:threonine-phosphate decarboxylase CobD n=1 Tax=Ancylothrix sp. D3o TaxID=2953691 RepID=UPI0021BB5939|nr:threonine-phosphate decarboxylase CobD [Ancylothrix sp. D3o]MCT7951926.1 threonine-phosphate decarboxylase CobD [Ancylothrix sp. D3o]
MTRPTHGGNLIWAAAIAGCPPSDIVDFSASISPLGPPASALAALQDRLCDLSAYPDPNYQELRNSIAQFHNLSSEWILPGNGSAELLTLAGWDFSELAETYLITPAFGDYWRSLNAAKAIVVECPLVGSCALGLSPDELSSNQNTQINLADVAPVLSEKPDFKKTGLLLNNPHNPTGKLFSKESILPYLDQFSLVVVDEAFMDFLPPDEQHRQSLISEVQNYPNLVILRSLTKFYSLAGLRLGYAIAHPDRLRVWQSRRDPWPVSILAVAAGVAALEDVEFQQKTFAWLSPTRSAFFEGLTQIPGLFPLAGCANFLLVKSNWPVSSLQEMLLKRHQIFIRDCNSFPELGDSYFRVAVRTTEDNQRLLNALKEIIMGDG